MQAADLAATAALSVAAPALAAIGAGLAASLAMPPWAAWPAGLVAARAVVGAAHALLRGVLGQASSPSRASS